MTTATFQPDGTAGVDSTIMGDDNTGNYGTNVAIYVGETSSVVNGVRRGLLKFTQLSDGTIPASAVVDSAVLSLWIKADESSNARTMRVYRLKHSWTEAGVTWDKYDGSSAWPGGSGAFGAADCEATDIGNKALANNEAVDTEEQFTLTGSAVQEIIAGTFTNNGFLLKMDTELNDCYLFYSSDEATKTSQRPKLVVTYHLSTNSGSFFSFM